MQPGEQIPEERQIEVQQILDRYADQMFSVMRQSKFDLSIGEFLQELAIGTAVMLILPGDEVEPIRYTCISLHFRYVMMKVLTAVVEKVYRKFKRPYEVLDQEFPDIKDTTKHGKEI